MFFQIGKYPSYLTVKLYANRKERRVKNVNEVMNLDQKRICDISTDAKVIEIRKKDCVTKITANPDGTLEITHERIISAA